MLHIIGIVISLFLSILLFTKQGKSRADLVLAFWLFLISLHLFCYYLLASDKIREFPYFLGLEIAMPLLHGPFFFWYTTLLTGKTIHKSHRYFHFLPAALVYIALSKFFLLSTAEKIFIYENNGVVGAVCHGPAGLVNIKLSNGKYLVDGKKVNAFTNEEEVAVKLEKVVPFALETKLIERGAKFEKSGLWQEHVTVDGRLITGQNPQSAKGVGEAILKELKSLKK